MGNITSKKESVIEKMPEKSIAAIDIDQSPIVDHFNRANQMLDPKTPAIPQTPLTQTIAYHLNRIASDDINQNQTIKTPSYLLRKKILRDLGYTCTTIKDDPRSPTLEIPRTPLNLAEYTPTISESQTSSFQYNTTLEDSCRDFNAKLDDITMEESEIVAEQTEAENETKEEQTESSPVLLCEQKTPSCESDTTPDFQNRIKSNDKTNEVSNANKTNSMQQMASAENISPVVGMYSTPLTNNKSHRTGRIPLSVINRRGASVDLTPLQSTKNGQELYSVEKYKRELSFNKDGSARKSKIPVYKK